MENSLIMSTFNPMVIDAISKFVKTNTVITDNNLRADYILQVLKPIGFKEIGCGTNRIVVSHESNNNYVYKIALDKQGITDNNLEYDLSMKLQPFVTITHENIGIISVAEHVQVMNRAIFNSNWNNIRQILFTIGQKYILNDVGPKSFLNWGVRDNGQIVILDYAYLTKITPEMNFRCKAKDLGEPLMCGGQLVYNNTFTEFQCVVCGAKFAIGDIAKTTDGESLGFNAEGVTHKEESDFEDMQIEGYVNEINYEYDDDGFNTTF